VGTGSGYQTVLLSHLASQVFSIERVGMLVTKARDAIRAAGATNVSLLSGDGTLGWREYAPYDAILVTAGSPAVPTPLSEQLSDGGRLLIPIGERDEQILTLFTKRGEELDRRDIGAARFVPLIGKYGWPS
jgi:protein-L-isoaspartate(D-aspartate) O-methyltransferase